MKFRGHDLILCAHGATMAAFNRLVTCVGRRRLRQSRWRRNGGDSIASAGGGCVKAGGGRNSSDRKCSELELRRQWFDGSDGVGDAMADG
eukprot:scaffold80_cov34-Cyclotella_meneghiniana.AAC.1